MRHTGKRLTSLLLSLLLGCTVMTGCTEDLIVKYSQLNDARVPTETAVVTMEETPSDAAVDTLTETKPSPENSSPIETVTSQLGSQLDVDGYLDRDSATDEGKNYKAPLSGLMQQGDLVRSFTFVLYAADGVSNMREFTGGFGISVTPDCPAATSPGWYQSDDYSQQVDGSYAEITWNVPEAVAPYIDAGGEVQIGYWWGNYAYLNLKNIICTYTRTAQLPVDSTQTISVRKTLNFNNDATKTVKVPLRDVIGEDGVPQAITFDITGQADFKKFTGAFGISGESDMIMTNTVAVLTGESSLTMTWIVPEDAAYHIPQDAEAMLAYWWSEAGDITLNSITIKYSSSASERPAQPERPEYVPQKGGDDMTQKSTAAQIAADIRVGWNLGNTLDSYDKTTNPDLDYETYWGNVKTSKGVFDVVKAKGFNAVRIPVSWTNHVNEQGTIDPYWMRRVQEVVDYAINDDLYVIINMHHDDYTWLNPVYAEEEAVTEKYTHIWQQIAERFRDYDQHLLFEGMNEPRMVGSPNEWTGGTEEERTVINHLLARFVSTVRATGGNNSTRALIVTTHAASITDAAVNGLVLPQDNNLIVSIHNYAPWKFTTKDYPNERRFNNKGREELERQFEMLNKKFVSQGIPVFIGEFGAENKDNNSDRAEYYSFYVKTAAKYHIPCFVWDNGLSTSYAILDRTNNTWFNNGIADAVVNAVQ